MSPLASLDGWPAAHAAAAVVGPAGVVDRHGDTTRRFPLASVTKLLTAWAVLVAVEEETLALDDLAGPPGATVEHLLAHASGLGAEAADPLAAAPGTRRVYSNAGYEVLATRLADAAGLPFGDYLAEAVLGPLGLEDTSLDGSPAHGATSTVDDLARLAGELLRPRLVAASTHASAVRPHFPDLAGVLPGFGRQDPNPWGLGPEIRGDKAPHWTGRANSPATFGHFGRAGTFLWVDPRADLALVVLTDRPFGPWAATSWPALADDVLAAAAG